MFITVFAEHKAKIYSFFTMN